MKKIITSLAVLLGLCLSSSSAMAFDFIDGTVKLTPPKKKKRAKLTEDTSAFLTGDNTSIKKQKLAVEGKVDAASGEILLVAFNDIEDTEDAETSPNIYQFIIAAPDDIVNREAGKVKAKNLSLVGNFGEEAVLNEADPRFADLISRVLARRQRLIGKQPFVIDAVSPVTVSSSRARIKGKITQDEDFTEGKIKITLSDKAAGLKASFKLTFEGDEVSSTSAN